MATFRPIVWNSPSLQELPDDGVIIPSYIAEPLTVTGSNDVRIDNDNSGELLYAVNGDIITGVLLVTSLFNSGG